MVLPDSKTRLLIVEMDDAFRRHLTERLRVENFKVYEACQDTEARQILQRKIIRSMKQAHHTRYADEHPTEKGCLCVYAYFCLSMLARSMP